MTFRKTFIISTEALNTYGTWILLSGIKLDNFKKNPVAFYDHHTWELPIGHWENIRIENSQLLADIVMNELDVQEKVYIDKINQGDLRGASAAFDPLTFSSDPQFIKPGQRIEAVIESDLVEVSLTPLPGNNDCLALSRNGNRLQLSGTSDEGLIKEVLPLLKIESHMKKINLKLNLKEEADEAEILQAIERLQLTATRADGLQTNFITLGKSILPDGEPQVMFEDLAKTNPEQAVKFLKLQRKEGDDKPIVERISDLLKLSNTAAAAAAQEPEETFDSLQKNDPARLLNLKRTDPAKFRELLQKHEAAKKVKK